MAAVAPASSAGAGSLWNPGSWHWESRNYDKWSEEAIRSRLHGMMVTGGGWEVRIVDLPKLKCETTINIRKGKKLLVFETSFTAKWEGRATDGSTDKVPTGEAVVTELMQDDVEEDFPVRVSVAGSAAADAAAKELMRVAGAAQIRQALRAFSATVLEHDAGLEKLALDAARRDEEAKRTLEAVVTSGEEKERLLQAQLAADAERFAARKRAEVEAATLATGTTSTTGAPATAPVLVAGGVGASTSGEGSVWNKNSYHWEEKPLTPWAKARLAELIKGLDIDLPGGSIKITSAELKGEASTSIRKGKKLVFFDFAISAEWDGQLVNDDGKVVGSGDGKITIPEFDQDSADDYRIVFEPSDDPGKHDKQLEALFKAHGVADLRRRIDKFVEEVKAK